MRGSEDQMPKRESHGSRRSSTRIRTRGTASVAPPCGLSSSPSGGAGWILKPGRACGWGVPVGGVGGRRRLSPGRASPRRGSSRPRPREGSRSFGRAGRGRAHQRRPPAGYRQEARAELSGRLLTLGDPYGFAGSRRRAVPRGARRSGSKRGRGSPCGQPLPLVPRSHGRVAGHERRADEFCF